MTEEEYMKPRRLFDRRLPEMDKALRLRVLTIVTNVANELMGETQKRERAWRERQPAGHHLARRQYKAKLMIEHQLLGLMAEELKAQRGTKPWPARSVKHLTAQYRKLKAGQSISGLV